MPNSYAPIPNPRTDPDSYFNSELEAAFHDPDDSDFDEADESHPLRSSSSPTSSSLPATYNFESSICDYDQPPPGSPPIPSSRLSSNEHSISNGTIPTPGFAVNSMPPPPTGQWWRRTASAVLPSHYVSRWGIANGHVPGRLMGGGTRNDGVFSNIAAKPSQGVRIQEGENVYLVPEESSNTAPPSYAAAQADAVPPYHTHSIFLPSSLHASLTLSQGSVVVDDLPTGTLFSFLWNALVSTTFQFVGFVLTWVMHTTHAARYGSRAGLGITLIQWGFGLRASLDDVNGPGLGSDHADPWPKFGTAQEADEWFNENLDRLNATTLASTDDTTFKTSSADGAAEGSAGFITSAAASEWLSFFLMTAGWFLLLTSSFGFWRVKRWERGIISSTTSSPARDEETRRQSLFERLGVFRVPARTEPSSTFEADVLEQVPAHVGDEGGADDRGLAELEMQSLVSTDPNRSQQLSVAIERENRLCEELRRAGLL